MKRKLLTNKLYRNHQQYKILYWNLLGVSLRYINSINQIQISNSFIDSYTRMHIENYIQQRFPHISKYNSTTN